MKNKPFDSNDAKFQWSKLKGKPLKDKIVYFWTYYGLMTVGILLGIGLIVWITVTLLQNNGNVILSGEFYTESINDNSPEAFSTALCEKLGLDPADNRVNLSGSYVAPDSDYSSQLDYAMQTRLIVRVASNDLDFWAASEEHFAERMSADNDENNVCADLREILSEETLEKLDQAGRLRYMTTSYAGEMPYLIDIGSSDLADMMGLHTDECLICFVANSTHKEAFVAMIDFLIE